MVSLAEAQACVAAARRRLLVAAAADGAVRGALGGAIAGGAVWVAAWWTSFDAGLVPLAVPVLGALTGAALALRHGVTSDFAALALDAAARTDEAFVSALSATGTGDDIRALTAGYAVSRCPPSAVRRFLPFRAPAAASAAAVATALLAAIVLVPRAAAPESPTRADNANADITPRGGGSPGAQTPPRSPRERVDRLRDAVAQHDAPPPASLAASVRKDLGSVTQGDLRALAKTLAAKAESAGAASRAIAALDRGDRSAAVSALREAIGGGADAGRDKGTGTATAGATPASDSSAPWVAPTWPLRYDRVIRRWLDETAAAEVKSK